MSSTTLSSSSLQPSHESSIKQRRTARRRVHPLHNLHKSTSPHIPWSRLSPIESTALRHQQQLSQLFHAALPPENAPPPITSPPRLRQTIESIEAVLNNLFGPRASPDLLRALVAFHVPHDLVSALDRALRIRDIYAKQLPVPKTYPPGIFKLTNSHQRDIEHLIFDLLRAFLSSPHQVLRPAHLHHDLRFFKLLFKTMFIPEFVEITLVLVEALLHLQTHPRLDLSQIPNLSTLVNQLTPYQLGAFCRVLSLVAEEPDGSSCSEGVCTGQCAQPATDWHHIKPMNQQLKERRSYLDMDSKALIHRNHATLLAIPGFLQKLVKLISRPPASRDDLQFVEDVTNGDVITVDPATQNHNDLVDVSETLVNGVAIVTVTNTGTEVNELNPNELTTTHPQQNHQHHQQQPLDDASNHVDHDTNDTINALSNLHINQPHNDVNTASETLVDETQVDANVTTTTETPTRTTPTVHSPIPTLENLIPGITDAPAQIDTDMLSLTERRHGFGIVATPNLNTTTNTAPLTQIPATTTTTAPTTNITPPNAQTTDIRDRRSDRNGGPSPHGRRRPRRSPDTRNPAHSWEILDENIAVLERDYMLQRDLDDTESDVGSTTDASRVHVVGGITSVDAISTTATASDAGNDAPVDAPTTEITNVSMDHHTRALQSEISDIRIDLSPNAIQDANSTDADSYLNSASQTRQPLSIIGAFMLAHHVDVFFVLYCLVLGKRRSEVQAELSKYNIFNIVKRYWNALEWVNIENEAVTEHNLKLHLVRFVHFMCDKTEDNTYDPLQRPFFSEHEKRMIKNIERNLEEKRHAKKHVDQKGSKLDHSTNRTTTTYLENENLVTKGDPDCSVLVRTPSHVSSLQYPSLHYYPSGQSHQSCPNGTNLAPLAVSWKGSEKGKKQEERTLSRGSMSRAEELDSLGRSLSPDRGLIMEITNTFMNTRNVGEGSQLQRYMLSGCLESFLRCATEAETIYLGQQGLLVHLLIELGRKEITNSDGNQYRQTSFDVLSQLVRWNRTFFMAMNMIFKDNHNLFTQVLDAISVRLIDSNVFVRSIALSLARFRAEDELALATHDPENDHVPYDFDNCVLWEFTETFRVRILLDLLVSVRVEEVSYENICCVNTTLILFVISCPDEDSMDELLDELADETIELELESRHTMMEFCTMRRIDAFDNFAKLIEFWLGYYRHQGTDVHSLEVSSDIPIRKFVQVANMLKRRLPAVHERVLGECELYEEGY